MKEEELRDTQGLDKRRMMVKVGVNTSVSVSYLLDWRQSERLIPGVHLHHMCLPAGIKQNEQHVIRSLLLLLCGTADLSPC